MATVFSRWINVTLPLFGIEAKLKLRAFNKREAPTFKAAVAARFSDVSQKEGETPEAHEARAQKLLQDWLALAKDSFTRWVKLAEPLKDEESETEIKTGAELYDEAPGDFVMSVMLKLAEFASLGDTEGNAYGSRSTSTVEAGQATTESPASITDDTDSQMHSTVQAIPISRDQFSRLA